MKSAMTERVYQEGTIYLYSINNEGLDKLNPARVTSVPTNNAGLHLMLIVFNAVFNWLYLALRL